MTGKSVWRGEVGMNRLFRYFYVSDLIAVVGASISYIAIYWTCAQLLSPAAVSLVDRCRVCDSFHQFESGRTVD